MVGKQVTHLNVFLNVASPMVNLMMGYSQEELWCQRLYNIDDEEPNKVVMNIRLKTPAPELKLTENIIACGTIKAHVSGAVLDL